MIIKIKECCIGFSMFIKDIKISPILDIHGTAKAYRTLVYIDGVLIRHCQLCGSKIKFEVIKNE